MIIESVINLLVSAVKALFNLIPDLPDTPDWLSSAVDTAITYINAGIGFVYLFIPKSVLAVAIPTVIAIAHWREIYHFVMWIVKKLPFGVE